MIVGSDSGGEVREGRDRVFFSVVRCGGIGVGLVDLFKGLGFFTFCFGLWLSKFRFF